MSFKIGDKIKIRADLRSGGAYHHIEIVTPEMLQYAGTKATIMRNMTDETYKLDCDNGEWYWPEETLIPLKTTNADKIRSMSDEELSEFLSGFSACDCCKYKDEEGEPVGFLCTKEYAKAIIEDWLRKPKE